MQPKYMYIQSRIIIRIEARGFFFNYNKKKCLSVCV